MQAIKNCMARLAEVGESARIVEVVYKYMEMLEGKSAAAGGDVAVEMTLAAQEGASEVENKKAMLGSFLPSLR
jgi:hypothetical protein